MTKWNPRRAVQEAEAALRHTDIVGKVQQGRGGLGLSSGKPAWSKAGPAERRKLVVEQVHRQEEVVRCTKAVAQAKVEKCKLNWRDLWSMEENWIQFQIGATYDVLPSPHNLKQWVNVRPPKWR